MQPMLVAEGRVVCPALSVADTAPSRMRGLLGRRSLDSGEGLLLRPAGSVHTAFMRFPIDVVFLDAELEVLEVRDSVPPWRAVARRGAKAVLELPAGDARRREIEPGIRLELDRPETEAGARPLVGALALAAGAVGVLAALLRFGFTSEGLVTACFLAALGVLAVIDYQRRILPNVIVLPAAALVLVLQLALFPDSALETVAASLGCAGLLLVLALVKPGGLGMGDVKLGLLLGAGLGFDVATALLLGCLALWPVALYVVLTADGPDARKQTLPLGPALALGAAIVALAG
jgi:leader peptidase (prepilin peptidase)/N-methyltransferase